MTNKRLVTTVVAMVTIIEDSHENFAINTVLILVQVLAQDIIITTLLRTHLHIMIVNCSVLANAPLVITIPLLDAIIHHTALLLNHVTMAIESDLTLTQGFIQIPNVNLISILFNNQFPIFITLPQQN